MIDRDPSSKPENGQLEPPDWHPDEQADVAKGTNDFTTEQADSLQIYINNMARILGLETWDIYLTHACSAENTNASIHPVYGRHVAGLSVNRDWFTYSPQVQRNTILHELLHVIHNAQTEVIRTAPTSIWLWKTFERETELMVDHLANMLEGFFDLPEQPLFNQIMDDINGK